MGIQANADCASVGWIVVQTEGPSVHPEGPSHVRVSRIILWKPTCAGAILVNMPKSHVGACALAFVALAFGGDLRAESAPPPAKSPSAIVKVNASRCVKLPPEQQHWLGPEWQRFLPFVRSCSVTLRKSPPLYLLSVWADDFEANLPKDAPAEPLPKPLIVDHDGNILGRLAVTDPTVTGNHSIVLDWNPADHSFIRKTARK
jgi:hypothetical protein